MLRFLRKRVAAAKMYPSIGHYALNIDDRVMGEFYKGLPKDKSKNKIKRVVSRFNPVLSMIHISE